MATSGIPGFKAALVDRLAADAAIGGAGVQVAYGLPFPKRLERELVIVWGTRAEDPTGEEPGGQRAAAFGQARREERWVQELIVSVVKPARETQKSTTERAYAIVAAIENSIRAWAAENPAWGNTVGWAQVTSCERLEEPANEQEREARVSVDIACRKRI